MGSRANCRGFPLSQFSACCALQLSTRTHVTDRRTDRRRPSTLCVHLSDACARLTAFIWCGLFSETAPDGCKKDESNGVYYWTAGQRIDPSRESTFVWRVTSTSPCNETVSLMSYTNWKQGEPDYSNNNEACAHLLGGRSSAWNVAPCSYEMCSVCELDMADEWSLTESVSDDVMGMQRLQTYTYALPLKLMQLFTA